MTLQYMKSLRVLVNGEAPSVLISAGQYRATTPLKIGSYEHCYKHGSFTHDSLL